MIPAGDPLRSQVAAQIAALMVRPDRAGTSFNVAGNPAGDQTWELNARNILVRAGPQLHAELQDEPQLLLEPPALHPQLRRGRRVHDRVRRGNRAAEEHQLHTAQGFYQRISTHHAHQQFDWVIKQQPAEPLHDRLRPLVHGRQFARRPAPAGRRRCGAPTRRHRRTATRARRS